jgi:hypothetical protein
MSTLLVAIGIVGLCALLWAVLRKNSPNTTVAGRPVEDRPIDSPATVQTARKTPPKTLRIPRSAALPATATLENRFEVHSTKSNRIYTIGQNIALCYWVCSCPGWKGYHHCKHLDAYSLPPDQLPFEVPVELFGDAAVPVPTKAYPPELSDCPDVDLSSAVPPRFVIFDLETTGLDAMKDDLIEIGAIRVTLNSNLQDTFPLLSG